MDKQHGWIRLGIINWYGISPKNMDWINGSVENSEKVTIQNGYRDEHSKWEC